MLRAVIFDFDGVITDSEILHLKAFNQALAPFNIQISTDDYYNNYLGLTDRDLFNFMVEKNLLHADGKKIGKLLEQKTKTFEKLAKSECKIIKGVRQFLQMLKQNNILTAICSGALLNEIKIILNSNNLTNFFELIVSAEQIKRGKPHPDGFELTLKKLNKPKSQNILPSECIVIEDSHWGLEAAAAARMHTIAVTNSYTAEQLSAAEKITDNLANLAISNLQKLCD